MFSRQIAEPLTANKYTINKIKGLHHHKDYQAFAFLIARTPINRLVESLEEIDELDVFLFSLNSCPVNSLSGLFLSFSLLNKQTILQRIKPYLLLKIMTEMNSDDAAELFQDSPGNIKRKIVLNSPPSLRIGLQKINSYENTCVGSIMNTDSIWLNNQMSIKDALDYLRKKKEEYDIISTLFVVNELGRVVGQVKTEDLFFAKSQNSLLEAVMVRSFVDVKPETDIEEIIDLFTTHNLSAVSVSTDKAVGVITSEDMVSEALDESTRIMEKTHGILRTGKPYSLSSPIQIVKSRIVWLLTMLITTTLTAIIIDKFEDLGIEWTAGISSAILVPMIPAITGVCGNSGGQTISTIIQSLARKEIDDDDFWEIVKKELKVSGMVGGLLGFFNFLRLLIYFSIFQVNPKKIFFTPTTTSQIVTTVDSVFLSEGNIDSSALFKLGMVGAAASSISLAFLVVLSKLMGVMIPFIALKLDKDPTALATPILTTVLDSLASVIFFVIGVFSIYSLVEPITGKSVKDSKLTAATLISAVDLL